MGIEETRPIASRYKGFAQFEYEHVVREGSAAFSWVEFDEASERHVLRKPLSESRVALVSTAGARLSSQDRFNQWPASRLGDHTFRVIPSDTEKLRFNHGGIDSRVVYGDPDIVFPIRLLRDLADEGVIGEVSPRAFSLMGYCADPEPLIAESAPAVADGIVADAADVVLLVPA